MNMADQFHNTIEQGQQRQHRGRKGSALARHHRVPGQQRVLVQVPQPRSLSEHHGELTFVRLAN